MKHPLSVIFLLIALLLPAAPVQAVDDAVEKTYCTQGIAYESLDDLKLDLLNNAKKAVINELFGEFIVASTAVENFVVTKDQIQTSSLGFVRVEGNTKFHNGDDFADVCVTIRAYVTDEDRAKFDPEKLEKKYCDADDDLTTAQLIAYVKDETVIQALIEYNPKLKGVDKESLLQLVQKVTYLESGFIPDTQSYCAKFEGYVVPVEIMAFLETSQHTELNISPYAGLIPFTTLNNKDSLNSAFRWYPGSSSGSSYNLSNSDTLTLISGAGVGQWQNTNTAPLILFPIDGDFDVQVKLKFDPWKSQAGLGIRSSYNTWLRLTKTDKPDIWISGAQQGKTMSTYISQAYSKEIVYLRIERRNSYFNLLYL